MASLRVVSDIWSLYGGRLNIAHKPAVSSVAAKVRVNNSNKNDQRTGESADCISVIGVGGNALHQKKYKFK